MPSSPMASAGAARNADVLTFASSGNIADAAGSIYAEVSSGLANLITGTVAGFNSPYPLGLQGQIGGTFKSEFFDSTNDIFSAQGGATATISKVASSWSAANSASAVFLDGTTATGAYDGAMVSAVLSIGCLNAASQNLNGTMRNLRIYRSQLSSAQLRVMTT